MTDYLIFINEPQMHINCYEFLNEVCKYNFTGLQNFEENVKKKHANYSIHSHPNTIFDIINYQYNILII